MKNAPLTVTLHIGDKQIDTLTKEQRQRLSERLSEAMSLYYTANPEEFRMIKQNNN